VLATKRAPRPGGRAPLFVSSMFDLRAALELRIHPKFV
jgi:hypothetical protein